MNAAADSESVHCMLKRLPQWLRADLASSDAQQRERAEDALFAMITACLVPAGQSGNG
tara:strand:- start:287 stop:460 length:174 start_codon:yes stop_codon:yes gene_type:complete